jgi:hypothetical protein
MSTSISSKKSLSSLGYRDKNLAPAGIEVDGAPWEEAPEAITSVIERLLDFSATVPAGTALVSVFSTSHSTPQCVTLTPMFRNLGQPVHTYQ